LFDQLYISSFFWHYKIDRHKVLSAKFLLYTTDSVSNFAAKLDLLSRQRRYRANKTFNVIGVPTKIQSNAKDKSRITAANIN